MLEFLWVSFNIICLIVGWCVVVGFLFVVIIAGPISLLVHWWNRSWEVGGVLIETYWRRVMRKLGL